MSTERSVIPTPVSGSGAVSRWMATGSLAVPDWARIRAWAGERADDLHHATVPRDGWTCRRGSRKITMNSVH